MGAIERSERSCLVPTDLHYEKNSVEWAFIMKTVICSKTAYAAFLPLCIMHVLITTL